VDPRWREREWREERTVGLTWVGGRMCWLEAACTIGLVRAHPWRGRLAQGVRRWASVGHPQPVSGFKVPHALQYTASVCLSCLEDRGPCGWCECAGRATSSTAKRLA
jgi:hypothetical protein